VALAHLELCEVAKENFFMLTASGGTAALFICHTQCCLHGSLHGLLSPAELAVIAPKKRDQ